jgi:tetratricopeptide (TPR) repeat protein
MTQQSGAVGSKKVTATAAPVAPAGKVAVPIATALETAGKLYLAGRLAEAERVCRQIIERRPGAPDAHNLLGVIRSAHGDFTGAAAMIGRAIELNAGVSSYYANLGEVQRLAGDLDQAEAALVKAIELDSGSAQAHSNLGIVYFEREDYGQAAACYEKAIALQADFPEAHNNLGNAYRALERPKEAIACYQRAVTLREAYNNMAAALRDAEDFESAEHAYRKAIGFKPDYIDAHNNLSLLLLHKDRTEEALRVLSDALKLDEKHVTTLLNVARVQLKRGAHAVAEQAVQVALGLEPDKAESHCVLGQIYHELDRHEQALACVAEAIRLEPEGADLHSFRAVILKSVGRLDEARSELKTAIELNPKLYGAYSNLNDLETFTADDALVAQMKAILAEAENPRSERYMPLHFALGKALEDSGDYPLALEHYAIGAGMRRAQLKYDEAETFDFFRQIKAAFTPETFQTPPWGGNPAREPVFIVGMPRSGSTLVEQIISSHPRTFGAGEIKVLHRSLGALRDRFPSIPKYPAMVAALEPAHFAQIADAYLAEVRRDAGGAERITDKLLTNFFFVGLIHILFPNARIIHTRRNPVDTCLSAYTKLFKDDMPHSYDFGELGRYYRAYEDLMRHWEEVLPPGVMITVDYEDVVADIETNARRLIDHVGLEWDEACLAFHKSTRAVKTASVVQVRKPLYATSVERWKRYGDALAPLLQALDYPSDPKPKRKPRRA